MTEPSNPIIDVPCPSCGEGMLRVDVIRVDAEKRPLFIDLYKCHTPECGRKAAIFFEPDGGLTAPEQDLIQREIARTGAFFPHTITQGGMGRWGKFGR